MPSQSLYHLPQPSPQDKSRCNEISAAAVALEKAVEQFNHPDKGEALDGRFMALFKTQLQQAVASAHRAVIERVRDGRD